MYNLFLQHKGLSANQEILKSDFFPWLKDNSITRSPSPGSEYTRENELKKVQI